MPAAKSRKRLPSMSSMARPSPRTGTIGYARGRLGDVQVSSYATWARAFGPGISVTRSGTGRSPARRLDGDDTGAPRLGTHTEYAVWIFRSRIPVGSTPPGGVSWARCRLRLERLPRVRAPSDAQSGDRDCRESRQDRRDDRQRRRVRALDLRRRRGGVPDDARRPDRDLCGGRDGRLRRRRGGQARGLRDRSRHRQPPPCRAGAPTATTAGALPAAAAFVIPFPTTIVPLIPWWSAQAEGAVPARAQRLAHTEQ